MRYILAILFGILLGNSINATEQISDRLIYKGDTIDILSNPLEQYFELTGKRELIGFIGYGSTACLRGYVAIWELKNDSLFLRQITSCHKPCNVEIKNADLYKMLGTDDVFAYWFTGIIRIPHGKEVRHIQTDYDTVYERELHLSFKNGIPIKERIVSMKKIFLEERQRQIAKTIQDTLFYQVQKSIDWDTTKVPWYDLCGGSYILIYNRKGNLKKVWVNWDSRTFYEKLDEWWWNMTDDRKCRRTIMKALKPISISYLDLPKHKIKVHFIIYYDRKTGKIELLNDYRF